MFAQAFQAAMADPEVTAILIHVDSPGGTVDGTQALAAMIFEARGKGKPIVTFTDGTMASAALWIGLAADEVVIDGDTTQVGSIGVVATHTDVSKAQEMRGVKTTEIVSSRFKRTPSSLLPLGRDGEDVLQENVNHIHKVFVGELARFRGVEVEALAEASDGRVFLGKKAIEVGLVDRVQSFHALVAEMQVPQITRRRTTMGQTTTTDAPEGVTIETASDLQAAFPELCDALSGAARQTGYEQGLEEGKGKGALAERERIQQVEAQATGFPGHTALVEAMKYDGTTTPQEAAVKVLEAERTLKGRAIQDLHDDAPKPVKQTSTQDSLTETTAQHRDRLIEEHMAEHKTDYKTALIAISKDHPEFFEAVR